MISKFLQILGLQPRISFKSFSRSLEQFFLTVGQKNFGNKRPYGYESVINYVFFPLQDMFGGGGGEGALDEDDFM